MDNKIRRIVARFKQLISQRVKIHEIRVFGSRAREAGGPDSDLDVLVVVDRADHDADRYISDCAWEAGFAEDIVVVPVVLSIDAIQNSPLRESVFIRTVYREGVPV